MIHVLHIGKTGGTAIRTALARLGTIPNITLHDHATRLSDCPETETIFFVVRHPVDRFVSGFNSRRRKGRPTYNYPWSTAETVAFSLFRTPSALADALGARNPLRRLAAIYAMMVIKHVRSPLSYWLGSPEDLTKRPRLIIGTMETLAADFDLLLRQAGIEEAPALPPKTSPGAHATPHDMNRHVSQGGIQNLERWYREDLALYQTCIRLRETSLGGNVLCSASD